MHGEKNAAPRAASDTVGKTTDRRIGCAYQLGPRPIGDGAEPTTANPHALAGPVELAVDDGARGLDSKGKKSSSRRRRKPQASVGLIVPVSVEMAACQRVLGPLEQLVVGRRDAPTIYGAGIPRHDGAELSLAIIQCHQKGQETAADAASALAKAVTASAFLVVGVAGSLTGGLRNMDVAFSVSGLDDRLGREEKTGHVTEARSLPEVARSAALAFQEWVLTLNMDEVAACAVMNDPETGETYRVKQVGTASTNVVLDAERSSFRDSIAGGGRHHTQIIEMEFAGALQGLRREFPRTVLPAAMFRGVSDAGADKTKDAQVRAAIRAMSCAREFIPYWVRREG